MSVSLRGDGETGGGSLSLQGEIDGDVSDEEEEYRKHPGTQGSGPVDVVVDVVRVQSHSGHFEVPELPGYIVAVCHVNGDQSEFKELGNVEAD